MSSLMERFQKSSTLEHANILEDSEIFNVKDLISTPIPALNIAYSARIDGGISPGLHVWAGPSKHFKTLFCLVSASAYLKKYPESICLYYDNEFGTPKKYFESAGIDPKRVFHSPFTSLEELRTDVSNQIKQINRGDKVVIVVDSLGMAASEKEIKDAEDGSDKADMTRAKVNKSLFRIILPHLRVKDIPLLVVQHTYQEMAMYPKTIVSGGTGTVLAGDNVYILGRQQEKEGKEISGWHFIINVEKSRYVKEKSKIPITVLNSGGIQRWSGLFDIALEGGYLDKVNQQRFNIVDPDSGEIKQENLLRKDIVNNSEIWKDIIKNTSFPDFVEKKYGVSSGELITEEEQEILENE